MDPTVQMAFNLLSSLYDRWALKQKAAGANMKQIDATRSKINAAGRALLDDGIQRLQNDPELK